MCFIRAHLLKIYFLDRTNEHYEFVYNLAVANLSLFLFLVLPKCKVLVFDQIASCSWSLDREALGLYVDTLFSFRLIKIMNYGLSN